MEFLLSAGENRSMNKNMHSTSNHILISIGCVVTWQVALKYFSNMEKLKTRENSSSVGSFRSLERAFQMRSEFRVCKSK